MLLARASPADMIAAFHIALRSGHHMAVDRLLAVIPVSSPNTASSDAHDKAVQMLRLAGPADWSTQVDGQTLLQCAVEWAYSKKRFAKLLAVCPETIRLRDLEGKTMLHLHVQRGRSGLVQRILAVCPEAVTDVDEAGCNALQIAVREKQQSIAEMLMAAKPEAVYGISTSGRTILHDATVLLSNKQFVAKLWQMNPQALYAVDMNSKTPFDLAVANHRQELIELFEWSLSLDEVASAFEKSKAQFDFRKRYVPLIWEHLGNLPQDIASIVFEYLGFDATKCRPNNKRTQSSSDLPDRGGKVAKN